MNIQLWCILRNVDNNISILKQDVASLKHIFDKEKIPMVRNGVTLHCMFSVYIFYADLMLHVNQLNMFIS